MRSCVRDLDACDAVVVNGEGTLHHGAGSEYFAILGAAQQLGKATLLINAVFEAHQGWAQVISRLDDFCVRDLHSLEHARSLGFRCRLVPDSFLAAQFDATPTIDLGGRIVVTDWHPARDADVGMTMQLC
jgi:polysaccharide pyruvyl transferase WcaK-like protein